jgi:membrane carboxypeptidase/penicillin-binding protein
MGNPLRKESLGRGMTGGGGAVPFFNGFMVPFMKDKPKETFPSPPSMPSEIKALMERNKREEREKLARAEQLAARSGASTASAAPTTRTTEVEIPVGSTIVIPTNPDAARPTVTNDPPPAVRPLATPRRTPEPPPPSSAPEGTRRKGKKGEG